MSDDVRLVIPAQQDFHSIARLVIGGLASRLELTYELLEDLQVAVDTLLALRDDEDDVAVEVRVETDVLHVSVGPFAPGAVAELDAEETGFGRRHVLEIVCDTFERDERDGGIWVDLTKRTTESAGAPG
ncbi:MAG TPA: hypothetical protein VJ986_06750 [Gaiellaceae bacterium]|nr:hypothetical protein [Gaiellaceae bacterium]